MTTRTGYTLVDKIGNEDLFPDEGYAFPPQTYAKQTKSYRSSTLFPFNPEINRHIKEAFFRLAENIAAAYRGSAEVDYKAVFPFPVLNDGKLTDLFRETAARVVGESWLEESPVLMTSEDFSYYQTRVPGVLFFLGAGSGEKGTTAAHHSPRFNVDDDALPTGVSLLASFACAALERL
jgi:amidohydrolase